MNKNNCNNAAFLFIIGAVIALNGYYVTLFFGHVSNINHKFYQRVNDPYKYMEQRIK